MTRIFYTKPSITDLEKKYAADAVDTGWGAKCYDYINRFEALFADYLGVKYAIATSSCTGALQMGLAALGVGKGDEVILADTNWIATAAPIVHLGAEPILLIYFQTLGVWIPHKSRRELHLERKRSWRPISTAICATWTLFFR